MTRYDEVYNSFLDLIIRDTKFFIKSDDANLVDRISKERMFRLLKHAVTNIMLINDNKNFEINFMEAMDNVAMCFKAELTLLEIDIIAYFMWQCYVEEEVVPRLAALKSLGFKDDEIYAISPNANMREFRNAYGLLVEENKNKVKEYKRRSRKDFLLKSHNFIFEK